MLIVFWLGAWPVEVVCGAVLFPFKAICEKREKVNNDYRSYPWNVQGKCIDLGRSLWTWVFYR
jgi:hypothetical protein